MIINKKLTLAVSGAVLLMAGQAALADSTSDIVDALISKGVLTEEEGKLISKGAKAKADATPTIKEKDGAFSISSPNGKNSIQLTGRMHLDARYNSLGTFGNENYYNYNQDSDAKSGASQLEMRRARIGIKGRLGGVADYLLQGNITGTNLLDEAYLDINKFDLFGVKLGKFKVPFGLEQLTSSNDIDFMERSYADQISPAKKLGLQLHGEMTGATYSGGIFQMNDSALSQKDHNLSSAGRISANFAELMGNKDMIMHVGLAGYNSNYEMNTATSSNTSGDAEVTPRGTVFAFTSGGRGLANAYRMQVAGAEPGSLTPGANNTNTCSGSQTYTVPTFSTVAVQTGTALGATQLIHQQIGSTTATMSITSATCGGRAVNSGYNVLSPTTSSVHTDRYGLEGILAYNNFKVQGEYSDATYDVTNRYSSTSTINTSESKMSADVNTWYAEGLWILTGEKYSDTYKKGVMGKLKPSKDFDPESWKGLGLWEVGFRVDAFDVQNTKAVGSSKSRFQGAGTAGTGAALRDECNSGTTGYKTGLCDGGATSYTAGIKWVLNPNMMFKANYTYTDYDQAFYPIDIGTKGGNGRTAANVSKIDHEDLFMLRGQFSF